MLIFLVSLLLAPRDFHTSLQSGLEIVFGNIWSIVAGSMIVFWAGNLVNAYVLAKMEIWFQGKHLWMRTIGSTAIEKVFDSGFLIHRLLWSFANKAGDFSDSGSICSQNFLGNYWEILSTPMTDSVVNYLKLKRK